LRDRRYRLISLDTVFGNQMTGALFYSRFHELFFGAMLPVRHQNRFRKLAHDYLDRSLIAARQADVMPIISAEIAWYLEEADFDRLRRFVADRGFEARVVCYLRAPLDHLESTFQQKVKIGRPFSLDFRSQTRDLREIITGICRVFGEGNASLYFFQPAAFPGGCVVQHFCQVTGIDFSPGDIRHENESLNLNAVKFLHAVNRADNFDGKSSVARVQRQVLIERLKSLPGPPLRFHPALTATFAEYVKPQLAWLEQRLGWQMPLTLVHRDPDAGIRSETDLQDFTPQALEWLAKQTGNPPIRCGNREETVEQVVRQLSQITLIRSPLVTASVITDTLRERWRRNRIIARTTGRL